MADAICSIPDCGRDIGDSRGLCIAHYNRWRLYGDVRVDVPIQVRRPAGMTLVETFRHYMPENPPPAGIVWPWRGRLNAYGYGFFRFKRRTTMAHRVAYELFREPIPAGLVIRHMNDTPHDVNPWNMELGTQADNMADMVARDRQSRGKGDKIRGSGNCQTHLSEDDVLEIRRVYASRESTQIALAIRYGVATSTVWMIVHRKTWTHI